MTVPAIDQDEVLRRVVESGPNGVTIAMLVDDIDAGLNPRLGDLDRQRLHKQLKYRLSLHKKAGAVFTRPFGKEHYYTAARFAPQAPPASEPAPGAQARAAARIGPRPAEPIAHGPKVLTVRVPVHTARLSQATLHQLIQILADDIGQHLQTLHNAISAALEAEAKS